MLEVVDAHSSWAQLELDVGLREPGAVHAFALATYKEPLPYPLVLQPAGRTGYFEKREGFKVSSLLANPMMLTMGFSVISLFVLPKLIQNMDPETLKEIQETQVCARPRAPVCLCVGGARRAGQAVELTALTCAAAAARRAGLTARRIAWRAAAAQRPQTRRRRSASLPSDACA